MGNANQEWDESNVLDTVVGSWEPLRLHMFRYLGDELLGWFGYFNHGEEEAVVGFFVPFVGGGSHDEGYWDEEYWDEGYWDERLCKIEGCKVIKVEKNEECKNENGQFKTAQDEKEKRKGERQSERREMLNQK